MAGGIEPVMALWRAWGIQTLVLLSFAVQVTLLVLADIRRRKDSVVLNFILWSAYMLADTTAVYALGHFVVCSPSPEHEIMSLWAPLLLVHLGGPGSITAYALEDNRLWLRHLQSLVVQIIATAYVLYEYSNLRHLSSLGDATILMFVVGVLKYGERVWALKCANGVPTSQIMEREIICPRPETWEVAYHAVQVHMSQAYGVFYSKDVVMYTWYGICIRVISPVATVAAFLVFHRVSHNANHTRADVIAAYVLLVGAVILEISSVLRAIFSASTSTRLVKWRWGRWIGLALEFLLKLAYSLTTKAGVRTMYWSSSMKQLNLLGLCTRTTGSPSSKVVAWMGWEEWWKWNTLVHSWSIPFSADIFELPQWEFFIASLILRREGFATGYAASHLERIHSEFNQLRDEILVWHIATHVYLSWHEDETAKGNLAAAIRPELGNVIKALSNYMFFLLAAHPDFLPGDHTSHVKVHNFVIIHCNYRSTKDLTRLIQEYDQQDSSLRNPAQKILVHGARVSVDLIAKTKNSDYDGSRSDPLLAVWVDLLRQAASHCGADFHVKRLSNGGEFITMFALLTELLDRNVPRPENYGGDLIATLGASPRV